MITRRAQGVVGLLAFGIVAFSTPEAASAPAKDAASCGRPDDAPGFGTPARRGIVPEVVCMDLQLAQDKAQAAGFTRIVAEDQSGRRRRKVNDQDWVVVSQAPSAGTGGTRNTRLVLQVLAYGDRAAPPAPDRTRPGRLPDLTCFDLQEAQDTLQSAGFYDVKSQDATGRGRRQFYDRNWTVTGQNPSPGHVYRKTTQITLDAVKDREPSPCSDDDRDKRR